MPKFPPIETPKRKVTEDETGMKYVFTVGDIELKVPTESLNYFLQIPWCKSLILNPSYKHIVMESRHMKASGEDSLFGETLRTENTVRHALSLVDPSKTPFPETLSLLDLGDGVNGHAEMAHGGFITVMMDEIMGLANIQYNGVPTYTVFLNVTFKAPVPTPTTLLCRAWITEISGRKRFTSGVVEDGNGVVYATAHSLFIEAKSKL